MKYLFWICWAAEMIVAIWWIYTELKLTHLRANPFAFLSFFYLLAALGVRYLAPSISNVMVWIPAVPLGIMGLIILVTVVSGQKWN